MKILGGTGEIGGLKGALSGMTGLLDTSFIDEEGDATIQDELFPKEDPVWFGPEAGVSEELPEYNIGGLVQGGGTTPTIANYFGMQGVSLGGSNKQSLAEMLGRR